MPIYEYACDRCGAVEEILQKFSDKPLTACKKCQGRMHKLISHSSFHLKGSGWYVTDYAKKASNATGAANTPAKTESAAEPAAPAGATAADAAGSGADKT